MIKKLDHVAVVVRRLDAGADTLERALGLRATQRETRATQAVKLAMLSLRNTRLELLEPLDPQGPLGRFLEAHGEGLYHICVEVDSVDDTLQSIVQRGVALTDRAGRQTPVGKIVFLPPQAARGVTVELIEKRADPAPADQTLPSLHTVVVAISNLEEATRAFSRVLGTEPSYVEGDPRSGLRIARFPIGDTNLELAQPTNPSHPMTRFLAKRGEGLYLLIVDVKDFSAQVKELRKKGMSVTETDMTTDVPRRWAFLHPKSACGVMVGFFRKD